MQCDLPLASIAGTGSSHLKDGPSSKRCFSVTGPSSCANLPYTEGHSAVPVVDMRARDSLRLDARKFSLCSPCHQLHFAQVPETRTLMRGRWLVLWTIQSLRQVAKLASEHCVHPASRFLWLSNERTSSY
jgi:hypothetical protein